MTDKKKKRVRDLKEKTGMTYQAALQAIDREDAIGAGPTAHVAPEWPLGPGGRGWHEVQCETHSWRPGDPGPECTCFGLEIPFED